MASFVSVGWLFVLLIYALIVGTACVVKWKVWDLRRRLSAFAVIVFAFHVWEEWVIPGGFWYLYNLGSNVYPMSQLTDMVTNFLGVTLGTIVVLVGINNISATMIMCVCLSEGLVHATILVRKSLAAFSPAGLTVIYNPGFLTAVLLFLPVGLALFFAIKATRPKIRTWLLGLVGFFLLINLTVILPEEALKDPQSSFRFNNKGYYLQYDVVLPNEEMAPGA